MLPLLASLEAFEARIPGGISAGDAARASAALEDASSLVRDVAGKTWVTDDVLDDDVPDGIVSVVIAAAKRAFINPDGVRAESIDNFSTTYATSSPDVYLTTTERQRVRQLCGKTGLWTQPTTRCEIETDTVYVDVVPEGEPFPLLARGDIV